MYLEETQEDSKELEGTGHNSKLKSTIQNWCSSHTPVYIYIYIHMYKRIHMWEAGATEYANLAKRDRHRLSSNPHPSHHSSASSSSASSSLTRPSCQSHPARHRLPDTQSPGPGKPTQIEEHLQKAIEKQWTSMKLDGKWSEIYENQTSKKYMKICENHTNLMKIYANPTIDSSSHRV